MHCLHRLIPSLATLLLPLLLACGGGGSGGDSATSVSAASEGPITGFGSVIMNGQRWTTEQARFEVEGREASQSDLRVGMVVRVEGRRERDGTTRADRVIFESRVRGPIREIVSLGPDTKRLVIFDIEILVSRAGTGFRDTSFDALTVDRMADVSGLVGMDDGIVATHLRDRGVPRVGASEVKLFGTVSSLSGGSFLLRSTEVLFDGDTELDDLGPNGVEEGLDVRVEGILLANDRVDASEIEGPRGRQDDDFDEFEVHGVISDFVSLGDFRIGDRAVDASTARLFPNEPELFMDGVRVEAEGRIDANGVLIASKLKVRTSQVRIEAEVADDLDIDPATNSLVLLGIPIELAPGARIRDDRDRLDDFGLDDVMAGDFLEIRGVAGLDGRVVASRLERERPDRVRLKGPVDEIDADAARFSILGVAIETDNGTQYEQEDQGPISETTFFDTVRIGMTVQVQDREDGDQTAIDFADEVELEEIDLEDDRDDDEDAADDADEDDEREDSDDEDGDGSDDD